MTHDDTPVELPRTSDNPIRVLIVDDQALIRTGFSLVISAEEDMEVIGEAGDGQEAIELAAQLTPDIILMDIRMPNVNGIEATEKIIEKSPESKILILTTFDLDEYAFQGLRAGASGFLLKDARPEELLSAIRTITAGNAMVSPRITRRLLEMFSDRLPEDVPTPVDSTNTTGRQDPRLSELTAREVEVLELIAQGLSNSEIASEFTVSEATVKTHITRLFTKTGVRDRAQLVIFAYECGLAGTESTS